MSVSGYDILDKVNCGDSNQISGCQRQGHEKIYHKGPGKCFGDGNIFRCWPLPGDTRFSKFIAL